MVLLSLLHHTPSYSSHHSKTKTVYPVIIHSFWAKGILIQKAEIIIILIPLPILCYDTLITGTQLESSKWYQVIEKCSQTEIEDQEWDKQEKKSDTNIALAPVF